jgi:hypothetical protein
VEFDVLPPNAQPGNSDLSRIVAWILDDLIRVPGTNFRIGLDPIVGLIPGIGDASTAAFSSFILLQSLRAGVPRIVLVRMALNILVNSVIGGIPGLGDLFSAGFKSNKRNYALLQKHARAGRVSTRGDWAFVIALVVGVLAVGITISVLVAVAVIRLVSGLF